MKSIYISLYMGLKELNQRWLNLSVQKQRKYLTSFFLGYLLLTIMVIIQICKDVSRKRNKISIEHIKNANTPGSRPSVLLKPHIPLIFKNYSNGK